MDTQTRKPKTSAKRVAKSLEAHSLIAVIFGALIYILAVTGTLSVFNHDLQRWEQPNAPEMQSISPNAAEKAALAVFGSEANPSTHLYINFPKSDLPRTVITTDTQAFFANTDGSIADKESFPWTEFLLDLHYHLHMPQILGLTVVGALGVMLLGLSMSGLLAHPRIFRDAFTFRRGAGRLTKVDLHNRLSVWTLPFHFSNALTGAILGLASILAFAIAAAGFNNDTDAVFSPVFGGEPAIDEAVAPVAAIAKPLRYMEESFPDLNAAYFILHDPGTAGQHVQVIAEHPDRLIFGDYYNFDVAGNYKGNTGISDGTAGQQITGAVYNVHFGNWGGLPVKLAYLVFGIALCTIIASGLSIYFSKRRSNGRAAPRLEAAWSAVIWGIPAMLVFTFAAALTGQVAGMALIVIFWIGLLLAITLAFLWSKERIAIWGQSSILAGLILALSIYLGRYGYEGLLGAGSPLSALLVFGLIMMTVIISKNSKSRQLATTNS
ncbi:MAG: PepSY-associated TM helix domain-containing protein [Parasphingorhabdus sp.]